MSDNRRPNIIWTFRRSGANGVGKKPLRVELFVAARWAKNYDPVAKKRMFPKPSLVNREKYWRELYRIRVDGKWIKLDGYRFFFMSLFDALELVIKLKADGEECATK